MCGVLICVCDCGVCVCVVYHACVVMSVCVILCVWYLRVCDVPGQLSFSPDRY